MPGATDARTARANRRLAFIALQCFGASAAKRLLSQLTRGPSQIFPRNRAQRAVHKSSVYCTRSHALHCPLPEFHPHTRKVKPTFSTAICVKFCDLSGCSFTQAWQQGLSMHCQRCRCRVSSAANTERHQTPTLDKERWMDRSRCIPTTKWTVQG